MVYVEQVLGDAFFEDLFSRLSMQENAVYLASSYSNREVITISSCPDEVFLFDTNTESDPFEMLDKITAQTQGERSFFAGFIGYEAARYIEKLPATAKNDTHLPLMWFAKYSHGIEKDIKTNKITAWAEGASEKEAKTKLANYLNLIKPVESSEEKPILKQAKHSLDKLSHAKAVNKVLEYIKAGDIFQANITRRERIETNFPSADLFLRLCEISNAPYASYIDTGEHKILSASPELFLKRQGKIITTEPIKGTRPRSDDKNTDIQLARELLESEKDRAELAMIVDLERNDLGRVCEYGSVKVVEPCTLKTFAQVHHLVATIQGELKEDIKTSDILRATFPSGSITGAPKIRAMEIIDELESVERGVYTGAVGMIGADNTMVLNVAIRTLIQHNGVIDLHIGGGIVADSMPDAEYEETQIKARGLLLALGVNV